MPFDRDFALRTALPLAQAAYDLTLLPRGFALDSKIEPSNFGFLAHSDTWNVIAFRGTETGPEWLDDFDGIAVPNEFGAGMVHQGFQDVYKSLRASLSPKTKPLVIVGHSLGAALATLCAGDFSRSGWVPLVYTFAGPRVGFHNFAEWIDNNTGPAFFYRIVNRWDIVPHLPSEFNLYEHVGQPIEVDGGFSPDMHINHSLAMYKIGLEKLLLETPKAA